jgi:2-isopropylmalate synthase
MATAPTDRHAGTAELDPAELLFDWNEHAKLSARSGVVDETLRDGLQSPSVNDPPLARKLELLERAAALGVDCFALGFPASRPRQFEDALGLARHVARGRLAIEVCCAARTLEADIIPVVEIAQQSGQALQIGLFIGSSPIRRHTEGWSLDEVVRLTDTAVTFAVRHGLNVLYVTEDSTRCPPAALERLYSTAIRAGATRICVADTVGHATPEGAAKLVEFAVGVARALEPRVRVEWHGHRDRGLDVANCLAAWGAGAERCHGTALGVGERSGNAPLEQLLVNLVLLGARATDLSTLPEYVRVAASALGVPIPAHQPLVGRDAFRTATGAHAAAIVKARAIGSAWLADRVFSGVPAELLGLRQQVDVGPGSGEANVAAWLRTHGLRADAEAVAAVLRRAKRGDAVLGEAEIRKLVAELGEVQVFGGVAPAPK